MKVPRDVAGIVSRPGPTALQLLPGIPEFGI